MHIVITCALLDNRSIYTAVIVYAVHFIEAFNLMLHIVALKSKNKMLICNLCLGARTVPDTYLLEWHGF